MNKCNNDGELALLALICIDFGHAKTDNLIKMSFFSGVDVGC